MADNMNGWQKLEKVQEAVKDGKPQEAEKVTSTITDPTSQKIFLETLASRCSSGTAGLPSCEIVGGEGNTKAVKFKGEHPMTVSREESGGSSTLKVTSNEQSAGQKIENAWRAAKDFFSNLPSDIVEGVRGVVKENTKVGDALSRANTPDSEQNRRWNAQLRKAEGKE